MHYAVSIKYSTRYLICDIRCCASSCDIWVKYRLCVTINEKILWDNLKKSRDEGSQPFFYKPMEERSALTSSTIIDLCRRLASPLGSHTVIKLRIVVLFVCLFDTFI